MAAGPSRTSLFHRLLFAFLAVVVVISGILTAVFYVFNKSSQERQIREQTLGVISAIHQSFRYQIRDYTIKDLKLLVSNPKLNDYITSSTLEKDFILLSVEKLFLKFLKHEVGYESISFVDSMGMETIKVDRNGPVRILRSKKEVPLFKHIESGGTDQVYIEDPRIRTSGYPTYSIGIHKTDDDIGKFGGAVVIDATLEPFFKYLEGVRIFGENPIWIFGPDGSVLKRPPNPAGTFDPAPYLKKEHRYDPECTMVKEGIIAYQDFAVVPGKPFARLALSIPSALLLKDTRTTTKLSVMIFLVSILLASAISLYISRFLSRPIIELAAASRRLAEGDLSTHVKVETTGEVQMLVDSFNQMADDLQVTTVSKNYMDNIIHSMADGLIVCNRDMTIETVNRALLELLGYGEDELVGSRLETIIAGGTGSTRAEFIRAGRMRNSEMVYRTKEGKRIPMLVTGSVIADKKGDAIGHVLIGKDITDRKRAEEALREANDTLNAMLQASPAAILTLNPDGVVTTWNEAAERIFGWSKDEIVGKFYPLVPDDELEGFHSMRERVRNGGTFNDVEVRRRKKDGSPIHISLSTAPLHDANGNVVGMIAVMNDITGRKRTEEELSKIQKLESIGILAGGIAHDFNNILTVILGYISMAKDSANQDQRSTEILQAAEKASFRAKDLTHQLLTFSRGGSPVKKTISIPEIIRESANFALRGSNVRCEFDLQDSLWYAEADEGQISQVIQNLVINANQAMPAGGTIRIRAENTVLDGSSGLPLTAGNYIKVVIEDQGTGIPNEHLPKIFDPYFTTKKKGSGLGLAIVFSILRSHGGYIEVRSRKGVGTTFTLHLPGSDNDLSEDRSSGEEVLAGNGKVLLMDDEEMVRAVVGAMLEAGGYEVDYAKDGAEAIDLYIAAMKAGNPFSTVIMDLTIPGGMGGEEAIRHLRNIDSGVKAIVSSGYSDHPIMANFREHGFDAVITKPFRISDLSRTLKQMQGDA